MCASQQRVVADDVLHLSALESGKVLNREGKKCSYVRDISISGKIEFAKAYIAIMG